jgi:phosphoglucosamine mutase
MTNLGVEIALRRIGIELRRAPVGDRHVLAMLQQLGWCVGGEGSGHLVCLDQHSTGDGIIAALQVLRAMRESASRLDALLAPVGLLPQVLINVALQTSGRPPDETLESEAVRAAVRRVEAELGSDGRILLRPSGTEPVIRVMVEGRDEHQVKRCAETLSDAVRGVA